MKLFYQYVTIFLNISPTSNYLHPLQVKKCHSSSRLVVGEDDNGNFRLEMVHAAPAGPALNQNLVYVFGNVAHLLTHPQDVMCLTSSPSSPSNQYQCHTEYLSIRILSCDLLTSVRSRWGQNSLGPGLAWQPRPRSYQQARTRWQGAAPLP